MAITREEQLRNNRRLARQALGAVALILAAIGLFTVLSWCVSALRAALDDTERKRGFEEQLYGLVMFDLLPFEDASSIDPAVFKQCAVWGALYLTQMNGGSLDDYERDAETGSIILPRLEVDTYLANLLGPDYLIEDGTFETEEFVYRYLEDKQGYLVPVTGSVGLYTPVVEKLSTQGGKLYVTVGYVPTLNNMTGNDLVLTAPTEPTKYMDYVFTRGSNRQWYLSALQESEMQPVASATAAPTPAQETLDTQTLLENNLDSTMTDAVGGAQEDDPPTDAPEGDDAAPDGQDAQPDEDGSQQPAE